jgi:hypothetical protein
VNKNKIPSRDFASRRLRAHITIEQGMECGKQQALVAPELVDNKQSHAASCRVEDGVVI